MVAGDVVESSQIPKWRLGVKSQLRGVSLLFFSLIDSHIQERTRIQFLNSSFMAHSNLQEIVRLCNT